MLHPQHSVLGPEGAVLAASPRGDSCGSRNTVGLWPFAGMGFSFPALRQLSPSVPQAELSLPSRRARHEPSAQFPVPWHPSPAQRWGRTGTAAGALFVVVSATCGRPWVIPTSQPRWHSSLFAEGRGHTEPSAPGCLCPPPAHRQSDAVQLCLLCALHGAARPDPAPTGG